LPAAIGRESFSTCATWKCSRLGGGLAPRKTEAFFSGDLCARWGLLTEHLNVDFVAPCGSDDVLSAVLSLKSVGTSSITLNIVLSGPEGKLRGRDEVVLVLTDAQEDRPCAIPDSLRKRIEPFCFVQ
jgi:acyl-CoA thioesterase FadM